MLGRAQVLVSAAAGFEQGDLILALAPRLFTAGKLEGVRDVGFGDQAAGQRLANIAGMGRSGESRVDEDTRAPHGLVVGLPHFLAKAADEIEMMARLQPAPLD